MAPTKWDWIPKCRMGAEQLAIPLLLLSHSVVSDSTTQLSQDCSPPWDFPSENTRVSCHFFSRASSPRMKREPPALAGRFFPAEPQGRPIGSRHGILLWVSLVAQQEGICLPTQETQTWSLVRKNPPERKWQLTLVFLPGKSRDR